MKPACKKSESGVVLIAVLSGILILTVVALALASSVRVAQEELANRKEHLQAYYMARSAVYTTAALLTVVSPTPKEGFLRAGQRSVEWKESLGRVKVEITDESGKIDINQAPEDVLERLLVVLGVDLESARTLATTILDWRSPSSLARWSEAAASGNLLEFDRLQATGFDFHSVEELLEVPGITPELFYGHYLRQEDGKIVRRPGLIDCVTVDSRSSQININYAPYPVLLVVAETEPQLADYIVAARETKPFNSVSELANEYPTSSSGGASLSSLTTQGSGRFTLLASGWGRGSIVARIQAVVNVASSSGSNGPFQILRWKDSYVQ
jgi:general secretion pathway protein K